MFSENTSIDHLKEQIQILKKENEAFFEKEKLLYALVETAVGDIEYDFFNNIVVKLAEWLKTECVIIGRCVDNNRVDAVPMYLDGKIINDYSYELKGTPCDLSTKKGYCVFEENIIELFPEDLELVTMKAEGYVGTALYNNEGQANGVLCAISKNKLKLPPNAEKIIKIVAKRITTEIDRINTKNQLEKTKKDLQDTLATKDKLFSIISHDLISPFNSIIGFAELLEEDYDYLNDETRKLYISIFLKSSKTAYQLVYDLLMWSRIQSNTINVLGVEINLKDIINESIKVYLPIAANKNIAVDISIKDDTIIFADEFLLKTTIANIFNNAIKFTPQKGIITIVSEDKDDYIEISISDNGIGIPSEIIPKLFVQGGTVSTMGTENEQGTGLGLIICKEFINKHNGSIWIESELGKGTKVIFTIPYEKE